VTVRDRLGRLERSRPRPPAPPMSTAEVDAQVQALADLLTGPDTAERRALEAHLEDLEAGW
jgi:hypothetical protein